MSPRRRKRSAATVSADQDALEVELRQRLAHVLKAEREAREWTQENMAELAGLHWTTVGKIERGRQMPSVAVLVLLARALDVPFLQVLAKVLPPSETETEDDAAVRLVRELPKAQRMKLVPVLRVLLEWKGTSA